jgi:hypothetical protein
MEHARGAKEASSERGQNHPTAPSVEITNITHRFSQARGSDAAASEAFLGAALFGREHARSNERALSGVRPAVCSRP